MSEYLKSCWVVTEGIAGTENQCLGLAEALGFAPVIKRVSLRFPWKQLSPWLCWGHQFALARDSDKIDPPWPDLVIASGRKSIGIALDIKKRSGGETAIVQVQDPRISPSHFDLVIVPEHDRMRGDNVIVTAGSLHRVTLDKIAKEQKRFESAFSSLPQPRVAVLVGGNSKSHQMTEDDARRLAAQLKLLPASLMVTISRRTDAGNAQILREVLIGPNMFFWDGQGDNPYFAMLGFADYIVVTEDSVSMASEAISTGKPVYIARLSGGSDKFMRFHAHLHEKGYARPFEGKLERWAYDPPDDMTRAVAEIRKLLG